MFENGKEERRNEGTERSIYLYIQTHIMRYKNNVLDKLNQTNNLIGRLTVQLNRNVSRDEILETLTLLKEQVEQTREMVSIEHDDFAQQFAQR